MIADLERPTASPLGPASDEPTDRMDRLGRMGRMGRMDRMDRVDRAGGIDRTVVSSP